MITKENFLKKYNISEELFQSAEISWKDLCDIYEDFHQSKSEKYENILEEFTNTYLKKINKEERDVKIHSFHSRVKNPEHLIEKIIRKRQENRSKYKKLDKTNYEKFVMDLIGIRCLVRFKADWESFHFYIISKFENNKKYYIKDPILDFDENEDHFYMAEEPKVHIRNGDARGIYDKILSPDCVLDGKVYRSVHYVIKYKGVYLEIQVRTLFEEGWSEVDHTIAYPYYQKDPIFKEYTELLNRLSGLADEMGGFFCRLKILEIEHLNNFVQNDEKLVEEDGNCGGLKQKEQKTEEVLQNEAESMNTPNDCLQSVLDE